MELTQLKLELTQHKETVSEFRSSLSHSSLAEAVERNSATTVTDNVQWPGFVKHKLRHRQSSKSTNSKDPRSQWVGVSISTKKTTKGQHITNKFPSIHQSFNDPTSKKERVFGVRKVWGCLKTCTSQRLAANIAKLCPNMNGRLQVRRQFATDKDDKITKWWFLIKGDEPVLIELEKSWGMYISPNILEITGLL